MALADFDTLRTLVETPHQQTNFRKSSLTVNTTHISTLVSGWGNGGLPLGTVPTSAVALSSSSAGALPFSNAGSGRLVVVGGSFGTPTTTQAEIETMPFMLVDRLSHQGGLAANTNASQTTNLPTAALTRYTTGSTVLMGIEIYTNIGSTASTLTTTYTNQSGTGSRTSTFLIPSSLTSVTNSIITLPFQSGDTGVRSVESVQLSAARSVAGNFGIVLFRPLAMIIPVQTGQFGINEIVGWNEEILDNACLQLLPISTEWAASSGPDYIITIDLAEV